MFIFYVDLCDNAVHNSASTILLCKYYNKTVAIRQRFIHSLNFANVTHSPREVLLLLFIDLYKSLFLLERKSVWDVQCN